jgi:NAD(P)H-dependent FMN reductase
MPNHFRSFPGASSFENPRHRKKPLAQSDCLSLNLRSMDSWAEYLIVSASLRSKSRSRVLAKYVAECYEAEGVVARLVDLRDSTLPFCDGETAYSHPEVIALSKAIAAARVVIIATPIYNFNASAALKNLIELTGESWESKVVGFLCAAGGASSYMSVMSLANSLMLDFRCLVIPRFVYVTGGEFSDEDLISADAKERIRDLASASTRIRYD